MWDDARSGTPRSGDPYEGAVTTLSSEILTSDDVLVLARRESAKTSLIIRGQLPVPA